MKRDKVALFTFTSHAFPAFLSATIPQDVPLKGLSYRLGKMTFLSQSGGVGVKIVLSFRRSNGTETKRKRFLNRKIEDRTYP